MRFPVDSVVVTQEFGENPDKYPKTGGHTGIDFAGKLGDFIYAAEGGKVKKIGFDPQGYGNYLIIDCGNGIETLYAHLMSPPEVSGKVKRGQIIGYMGSTGWSSGVHLHFEVRLNGKPQNPRFFFDAVERLQKVTKSKPSINLRISPVLSPKTIYATLYADDTFDVLEENQDWVRIKIDKELWVHKSVIEKVK